MTIIRQLEGIADVMAIDLNYTHPHTISGSMTFRIPGLSGFKATLRAVSMITFSADKAKDVVIMFRVTKELYLMLVADSEAYTMFIISTRKLGRVLQKASNSKVDMKFKSLSLLIGSLSAGIISVYRKSLFGSKWVSVPIEDVTC